MANSQGTFLAYLNHIEPDATTLTTATDAEGDRVVGNLKTRESDDTWRFAVAGGATSATVTAEFASDQTIGLVTAQFPRTEYTGVSESAPNFATTDTIRVRLLDNVDAELEDSTAVASGVDPGYMTWYWKPASAVASVRKVEITFDAISRVSAGFCDVGTIGAWGIIEPSVGFSYPGGYGWLPNIENQKTAAGRLYAARFDPVRRWSLTFDWLTNAEAAVIDEMMRYSGGARQVFIRRGDLPSAKDAMHAIVVASRDMESRTPEIRQQALTFEEFI